MMDFSTDIINYNFDGMCSEAHCSNKYTHVVSITHNGIELMIPLCKTHADLWDDREEIKVIEGLNHE